ncbi:hypothetical protein PV327_009123 [Microctonus hyperodae]|uniref:DUF4817 domain-containing protein n=1 Tax=Microctonus hyperodae TaxID=165561 RepID=A0AA39FU67_MICHY|nr:hypothetical protein PV327_009123 [Microctonus hyperodae]
MPNDVYFTNERVYFVKEFFRGVSLRTISNNFVEKNTNRPKPSPATIKNIVERFNATGNVNREGNYKQPRKALSKDIIATICRKKQCDNNLSITAIAKSLNISTTSVRSVLRKNNLYDETFSHRTGASSNQSISGYNIKKKSKQVNGKMNDKSHETTIVNDLFNKSSYTNGDSQQE